MKIELLDVCLSDYFQGWSPSRGPHYAVFTSQERAAQAIRDAAGPSYFPAIWVVSDHGNVSPYTD